MPLCLLRIEGVPCVSAVQGSTSVHLASAPRPHLPSAFRFCPSVQPCPLQCFSQYRTQCRITWLCGLLQPGSAPQPFFVFLRLYFLCHVLPPLKSVLERKFLILDLLMFPPGGVGLCIPAGHCVRRVPRVSCPQVQVYGVHLNLTGLVNFGRLVGCCVISPLWSYCFSPCS